MLLFTASSRPHFTERKVERSTQRIHLMMGIVPMLSFHHLLFNIFYSNLRMNSEIRVTSIYVKPTQVFDEFRNRTLAEEASLAKLLTMRLVRRWHAQARATRIPCISSVYVAHMSQGIRYYTFIPYSSLYLFDTILIFHTPLYIYSILYIYPIFLFIYPIYAFTTTNYYY